MIQFKETLLTVSTLNIDLSFDFALEYITPFSLKGDQLVFEIKFMGEQI